MPGSPNKLIVDSLIQTIQRKDSKLYEALSKMADDLNKSYSALFDGILPASSGKNLDLTETPEVQFPDFIAFIDKANLFIENQTVLKEFPEVDVQWNILGTPTSGIKGRLTQTDDGEVLVSGNLYFDGTDWQSDDTNDGAGVQFIGASIDFLQFISGDIYHPFQVDDDKIIRLGNPVFFSDSDEDNIVIGSEKYIRASDSTDLRTLPILKLDEFDIIQLGSNAGTLIDPTSGEGNVAIPTVVDFEDLPTPGATRNGIIIIYNGVDIDTAYLIIYANDVSYAIEATQIP